MPKGGRRPNSGRKPKAEEVQIIEKMDAALAPSEAWEALANRVVKGDVQAIKLWLAYRYGQPKQDVKLSGDGSVVSIQLPKEK